MRKLKQYGPFVVAFILIACSGSVQDRQGRALHKFYHSVTNAYDAESILKWSDQLFKSNQESGILNGDKWPAFFLREQTDVVHPAYITFDSNPATQLKVCKFEFSGGFGHQGIMVASDRINTNALESRELIWTDRITVCARDSCARNLVYGQLFCR
jgi:hypothetical protein